MSFLIALLVGGTAGLVGALCGVGGGIVLMPVFLFFYKLDPNKAVATSLSVVLVTALSSTLSNSLSGDKLVDWKLALPLALGAALASWFGADLMRQLSNQVIIKLFGVILILAGARALLK